MIPLIFLSNMSFWQINKIDNHLKLKGMSDKYECRSFNSKG